MDVMFKYRASGRLPKNPIPGSFYYLQKSKSELWFCFDKNRCERVDNELIDLDADKVNEIIKEYLATNGLELKGYATEDWVKAQKYLTKHQNIKTINGQTITGTGNVEITGVSQEQADEIEKIKDKADKSEIPSIEGLASESWVEDKGYLTEHQPLTDYVKKTDIYTKDEVDTIVDGLTDDSDFIGMMADKADKDSVYTKDESDSKYLTEHQDISGKADKSDLDGLATEDYVDGAIERLVDGAPEALNTLKEIADWISSDESWTAELISQVSANESNISTMSDRLDDMDSDFEDIRNEITDIKKSKLKWRRI